MNFACLVWLESERERINQRQDVHLWLFPFYQVADFLVDAACELEESLSCGHDDFDDAGTAEEGSDRLPKVR